MEVSIWHVHGRVDVMLPVREAVFSVVTRSRAQFSILSTHSALADLVAEAVLEVASSLMVCPMPTCFVGLVTSAHLHTRAGGRTVVGAL